MLTGNRKKLVIVFTLLLVAILLSTTFSTLAQDDRAGKGGRFVIACSDCNTSLDPFVSSWHSWQESALFSYLFWRDNDGNYVGYLADTWEITPDGKSLTINLIQNATFSDGTPVNAEAVKWNLLHYADPEVGSSAGADFVGLLEDVEVLDEYSLTLHLSRSYAPLFFSFLTKAIVSPTAYEQYGVDDFGTHPVGAGPFNLKELNTDNYVLYERNPDFTWAPEELYENTGPVYLDEFQILFIGEDQTVLAALETGEIHYAGIPPQNVATIEGNPDIETFDYMVDQIRYLGFNTSKAPWDNEALRLALSYAVNRDEYVELAWDGRAVPLYQPLPPTIWGHNPELDASMRHYDPEKAMALLDEIGYTDVDGDGMREDPNGDPWVVRLSTASDDEWRRSAEVIEGQFRDVGVQVEIEILEWTALIDLTTTGTHDLFILLYGYQDPSILTYFFDPARKGGSNRAWYSTDELTDLLITADSELNQEKRFEDVRAVSQYIIDHGPWIFLAVPQATNGVRKELKGWKFNFGTLDFLYWNAYFETDG